MIILSKPEIGDEEIQAVSDVLRSGMLAGGVRVKEFEDRFAALCEADHAVAVGSGTAALHVGLMAMGIGEGDEVIVPSFTFAASANSVKMVGATPVFADIDSSDYTLHADAIKASITSRTKAVMPVHLYGQMAPMGEIVALAESEGLAIIEDAAQAHLAETDGYKAGSAGDVAAFSFYPTKNMTTGEGGMITTSDGEVAERARWIRNQGMAERYVHKVVGINERMTEIEAAIGLVQLTKLEAWTDRRREIAAYYGEHLDHALNLPAEREGAKHVYHQYTIAPDDRDRIRASLREAQIGHDVYYPKATHQQEPYVGAQYDLPVTEKLTEHVVSIPVRPGLTQSEIDEIITTLNAAVA